MIRLINISFLITLLLFTTTETHAQKTKSSQGAGQQRHAEKGLKDNDRFFFFISSTITNSGTEEEKELFKEAVQRDFFARLLYMQFQFHDSFLQILKSQKLLIDIYSKIIERESYNATKLLNDRAPSIIHSGDFRSRHYLQMGYRSARESLIHKVMADNYRNSLYSMRLYQYIRAIKLAKYSRRYALLAAIEVARPDEEKIHPVNTDFSSLLTTITTFFPDDNELVNIHYDNYYMTQDNLSLYDEIWDDPQLEQLADFQKYQERD